MNKKRVFIYGVLILVILLILAVLWYFFLYTRNCSNLACFNANLEACKRASFTNEETIAVWAYKILGKNKEECEVNAKLLQLREGQIDIASLEGKEMICSLPLTYTGKPESSLERCHGRLKEEMQKIMINRAHKYIMDNLGQISEEMNRAV